MTDKTATRVVTIVNPQGMHLRPADLFVRLANQFQATVEIMKDGELFDGKSVLSMLTLAAVQGTQLSLQASGPDAEDALTALDELVRQGFGEMNAAEPSNPVATDENRQAG
jgi:phosphotransferase system HPr (HPr) family protein